MYHCLTLLLQSQCPLTLNLILMFPHTVGSCPLSTIVTPQTFAQRGNRDLVIEVDKPRSLTFICLACLVMVKSCKLLTVCI